jgi:hypothetical protein
VRGLFISLFSCSKFVIFSVFFSLLVTVVLSLVADYGL